MHLLKIAALAFSAASVAQASWLDPNRIPNPNLKDIKRQATGGTSNNIPETTTTTPRTTTTLRTTTSEPTERSTSSTPPPTTSAEPPKTTTPGQTTPPPTTTTSQTPIVETKTETIISTNSDGSVTSYTTARTTTSTPGLNTDASSTSGMSDTTRNTVIGVVVGVGGAIVLGGLAFVAWRIWGRKKQQEESDGLMSYGGGYHGTDKSDAGTSTTAASRTPFQTTLENYHAPTQVNASSNF